MKTNTVMTEDERSDYKRDAEHVGATLKTLHIGDHITDREMLQFIAIIEPVAMTLGELGREYWFPYIELDKTLSRMKEYAKNRGILPK